MQLYEVSDGGERCVWAEKLADAHGAGRLMPMRTNVRIRLYDYPDNKAAFCCLFNGRRPKGELQRAWGLTNRGGLMELPQEKATQEIADEL